MDNLKELYDDLNDKKTFIKTLSKEYGIKENSIRVNWMVLMSIPDDKKERVHELLINALKQQIDKTNNLIVKF